MDTNLLLTMLQTTYPRSNKESNMISPIGIKNCPEGWTFSMIDGPWLWALGLI